MVKYRLSVVKSSTGGYLVNHYHKVPHGNAPDMDGVILYMARLHQRCPDAIIPEPTLVGLDDNDRKRVIDVRERLLKGNLESRV